jgi:uncharacterized membrane protein
MPGCEPRPLPGSPWPTRVAILLLALATGVYTVVNLGRLARYVPLDFDLAIFTQGIHLLGRGERPFVTIRGMHLLGEHATWVHVPLLPLYRLLEPLGGARVLVLIQSAALALSAWILHRHARRELSEGTALLVLAAYLLYPPLQYCWLEYYEPVTLAVPALFVAFLAVRDDRPRTALVTSGLALVCMENLAATIGALGLYALVVGRRRLGLALVAGALLYALMLALVIFPALNPGGYAYGSRLYNDFAKDVPGAVEYLVRPDHVVERVATSRNAEYLVGLLVPLGFLPLAAPIPLLVAAQLPLNLVASWPYAHEIRYHYVAPVIPFVFLALVGGLRRLDPGSRARRAAIGLLILGIVGGQLLFAPSWLWSSDPWRPYADRDERSAVDALLASIPAPASVCVAYRFLPHVAARERVYMFPDCGADWPEILLLDLPIEEGRQTEVLTTALRQGGYRETARTHGGTALFVRAASPRLPVSPPGPATLPRTPPGGWPVHKLVDKTN